MTGFWQDVVATVLAGSILLIGGALVGMVLGAFSESVKARVCRWLSSPQRWCEQVRGWRRNREQRRHNARIEKCANSDGGHDIATKQGEILCCARGCGYEKRCSHKDENGVWTEVRKMEGVALCGQCGSPYLGSVDMCDFCEEKHVLSEAPFLLHSDPVVSRMEPLEEYVPYFYIRFCADRVGCKMRVDEMFGDDTMVFRKKVMSGLVERMGRDLQLLEYQDEKQHTRHEEIQEKYDRIQAGDCPFYRTTIEYAEDVDR